MSEKIYKNIIWLGLAAVFIFTPLAKGAVQLWSITPIEAIVITLVFLWLWRANNAREEIQEILRKTKIDLPIWLFLGLAAVSGIFSIYKYASLIEMLRLLTMAGVFYLIVNNFDRRMSLSLTILIIIMATSMSALGLAQYFLELEHSWWKPEMFLASTYVNHNHFAGYLELAIPLAIGVLIGIKSRVLNKIQLLTFRFALLASLIVMSAAFIFSHSRAGWFSLLVSLIVMNIILIKRKVLKKQSLIIFLLFILLGLAYIYAGSDSVAERLRIVEQINNEGFFEGREKIWRGSIQMIIDNPIVGTGIGTLIWGFPPYRPQRLNVRTDYAHNDYLHFAAEMGVLALPLMLWMICVVVGAGFKNQSKDKEIQVRGLGLTEGLILGSAVGILSLAIHGLIDFNFHIPANMLVVAAVAGLIMRNTKNSV